MSKPRAKQPKREPDAKKRYRVCAEVTISVHVDVLASNEDEARALAGGCEMQSPCYHCSNPDSDVWGTSGELDGEPKIIDVTSIGQDEP